MIRPSRHLRRRSSHHRGLNQGLHHYRVIRRHGLVQHLSFLRPRPGLGPAERSDRRALPELQEY